MSCKLSRRPICRRLHRSSYFPKVPIEAGNELFQAGGHGFINLDDTKRGFGLTLRTRTSISG
jgi:hypothetical protein